MSIKSSNFECNKIMSQDEEVVALYSYGELVYENDYPYIAGHVTDNSSTFTFRVNNADVTVNVGANGWWKWRVSNTISLQQSFTAKTNIDRINFVGNIEVTNMIDAFYNSSVSTIDFSQSTITLVNNASLNSAFSSRYITSIIGIDAITGSTSSVAAMFCNCYYLTSIGDLSNISVVNGNNVYNNTFGFNIRLVSIGKLFNVVTSTNNIFNNCTALTTLNVNSISASVSFETCSSLTYQSMLNIANALCDNNNNDEQLTITFNSTAWNALTEEQRDTIALIFLEKNWTLSPSYTIQPYIKGHVTDGSSTFKFWINSAQTTVQVDDNGWWKYKKPNDINISSIESHILNKTNIDKIVFSNTVLENVVNMSSAFANSSVTRVELGKNQLNNLTEATRLFSTSNVEEFVADYATFNNVLVADRIFNATKLKSINLPNATFESIEINFFITGNTQLKEVILPNATFSHSSKCIGIIGNNAVLETIYAPKALIKGASQYAIIQNYNLQNITLGSIATNLNFADSPLLTLQSVLNLINAVDADGLTFTLHSSVLAKCNGEWADEINQAKANLLSIKGYTVTLN